MHPPKAALTRLPRRSILRFLRSTRTALGMGLILSRSVVTLQAEPAANETPLRERDRIEASFTFSYSDHHTQTHAPGITTTFDSQRSGSVSALLDRYDAYSGVDSFELQGSAKGSISVADSIVTSGGGGTVSNRETGSGAPVEGSISVDIDSERGVYSFALELATETQVVLEGPMQPTDRQDNIAGFSFASPEFPLPDNSEFLFGEMEVPVEVGEAVLGTNLVPLGVVMKQIDGGRGNTVKLSWQFGHPSPKPELELLLSFEDYAKWLPEGPLPGGEAGAPGNTGTLVATLRRKDGGELKRGATVIRFLVAESSAEPGYCLNYPVTPGPDHAEPDLRYVEGGDAAPLDPLGQEALTDAGDWRVARARVGSFDWGAYGSVKAEARVPGYEPITSIVEETGEESLRLPKRPAESAIGDAWRARFKADGLADDDDSESSPGNRNDGDGYTLYEEYRGLVAREKHSRRSEDAQLDPRHKDLVVLFSEKATSRTMETVALPLLPVRDRREAEMRAGLKLFEAAAERIHAIAMDQSEAPESREINVNGSTAKRGGQHGVLVYDVGNYRSSNGEVLEATGAYPLAATSKTPKTTDFIAIDFAGMIAAYPVQAAANAQSGVPMPYTLDQELANTVAHEIAHACSVGHHGDKETNGPTRQLAAVDVSPRYRVIGIDGREITDRPFSIEGRVAGEESQSCGDQSCLMIYPNFYQWRLTAERGRGYTWQALLPYPMGTRLCSGSDGATPNTTFGPAAPGHGNCKAQLRLRDY